ncbi:MAG TPA: hypothetical protein PK605_12485 [Ignavibacteria bacterium]|nr:hypothetical protein [Bacteroidota bacterium]HRE11170.1 hypothetical protein [Ignavibacteria bacterium]HRF64788.1 hypothetical protein [Ignavibacteria bacterium]HRJ05209.1 hypothetical protein [Ignavibacteria bacterium]HRJ85772.1 hypothetical protein [Ignavibacteria bacterium]
MAEDITINNSGFKVDHTLDTIVITRYGLKEISGFKIYRKEFQKFVSDYPNPWVENDIIFELEDSAVVKLTVLDKNNYLLETIFEFNLTRGIYTVKLWYVFNLLPPGNYKYNLQFGNENIIKKLDIISNK